MIFLFRLWVGGLEAKSTSFFFLGVLDSLTEVKSSCETQAQETGGLMHKNVQSRMRDRSTLPMNGWCSFIAGQ